MGWILVEGSDSQEKKEKEPEGKKCARREGAGVGSETDSWGSVLSLFFFGSANITRSGLGISKSR